MGSSPSSSDGTSRNFQECKVYSHNLEQGIEHTLVVSEDADPWLGHLPDWRTGLAP